MRTVSVNYGGTWLSIRLLYRDKSEAIFHLYIGFYDLYCLMLHILLTVILTGVIFALHILEFIGGLQ
jgi:hypothetical protein